MTDHSGNSRVAGLARNFDLVRQRTGLRGMAELFAERALPTALSYRRTFVLRADCSGEPHPELAPTRVHAPTPALVALFADLARTREPEIEPLSARELSDRLGRGDELWLFHVDGEIGHLRWVTRRWPRTVSGFALPLGRDERVGVDTVTLPRMRRCGLARMASSHVRYALRREGVTSLYGFVNGSNRRWHARGPAEVPQCP